MKLSPPDGHCDRPEGEKDHELVRDGSADVPGGFPRVTSPPMRGAEFFSVHLASDFT